MLLGVFLAQPLPCFLPLTSTCKAPEIRFFGSKSRDHNGTKMKQAVFVRHKRERNVYHVVWFEQGRERTRSYPTKQEAERVRFQISPIPIRPRPVSITFHSTKKASDKHAVKPM